MEQLYSNYSLKNHNSFGLDVKAQYFYQFETGIEIQQFCKHRLKNFSSYKILGAGNNVLLTKDIEGVVIQSINNKVEVVTEDDNRVILRVGAGFDWDKFVAYTLANKWYGLENLSLIPSSMGAAPVQNIGAYGVEVEEFIDKIEVINLDSAEIFTLSHDECRFSYRNSIFKKDKNRNLMILNVYLSLSREPKVNLSYKALLDALDPNTPITPETIREKVIEIRRSKLPDPKIVGNAGSFFKNPILPYQKAKNILGKYPDMPYWETSEGTIKFAAGWLIEQCGYKGKTTPNGVGVCPTQALVLINHGATNGKAIVELAQEIISNVEHKFGVVLEPEVNIW